MADTFMLIDTNAITKEFNQVVNQISVSFTTQINQQLNASIDQVTSNVKNMGNEIDQAADREKPKKLSEGLNGLKTAIETTTKHMSDLVERVATIGYGLSTGISEGVQKAKGLLSTYTDSCGNLDTALVSTKLQEEAFSFAAGMMEDPAQTATNAINGFGAVCAGAIGGLASMVAMVENVQGAYTALQGTSGTLLTAMNGIANSNETALIPAFTKMSAAILPTVGVIALIALAITGLVLGFQYLYENSAVFRDQINGIFASIQEQVSGVINGLVVIIQTIYDEGIKPFIDHTMAAFDELWNNGLSAFVENVSIFVFQLIEMIMGIWNNAINPFVNLLLEIFLPMFNMVWDAILAIAIPIIEKIMEYVNLFMDVLNIVIAVLNEHVWPIFQVVFDGLSQAVGAFWEFIEPIFAWFKELLSGVVSFLLDFFLAPFDIAFQTIVAIVKNIAEPIGRVFDGIKQVFQGIIDFVTGIFSGDWSKAWDGVKAIFEGVWNTLGGIVDTVWGTITGLFSKGGQIFSGVVDGIAGAFQSIVNTMIRGINKVIAWPFNKINDILNDVRSASFMGITPFSFIPYNALPVPQIPELATGGIITQPTLAMIGERGKEAVMPLEHNTGWIDELARRTASYGAGNGENTILLQRILSRLEEMSLEVDLDGEVIYRNQERLRMRKGYRFSNI